MKKVFVLLMIILLPLTGCLGSIETRECKQTFDINVIAVENCSLSGRTLSTILNGSSNPKVQFSVKPNFCIGAKSDGYASIYFKVENYSLITLKTISGTPYIRWTRGTNTWYLSGDEKIGNLDRFVYYLEVELNPLEEKTSSMDIVFYNKGNTWNKNYKIKLWDV